MTKLSFARFTNRILGISTPFGGVQWAPSVDEAAVAQRLVRRLEDKRVLYASYDFEVPSHCVESVLDIRRLLTAELERISSGHPLAAHLRIMRAACRRFVDESQRLQVARYRTIFERDQSAYEIAQFFSYLGELRGLFGTHLAEMVVAFKLDIEEDLARILPPDPEPDP